MTSTVVDSIAAQAAASPNGPAIRTKQRGVWVETSWATLNSDVISTARGLVGLGITPGAAVGILAENSLDWILADLGIRAAGAQMLALPTRASVEQLRTWLSNVSVVFCGDQEHVEKVISAESQVRTIVVFDSTGLPSIAAATILPATQLREAGSAGGETLPPVNPAGVAFLDTDSDLLVPTTGTEVTTLTDTAIASLSLSSSDRMIAIAPFTDLQNRTTSVYPALVAGAVIHIPETLTSIPDDLQDVSPTVISGPSRLYELLYLESQMRQRDTGRIRRRLISWGLGGTPARGLRKFLVTRPIAARHGLGSVRHAVLTGADGLTEQTLAFYSALGVSIVDAIRVPR